jgi:hypothetical protein
MLSNFCARNAGRSPLLLPLRIIREEVVLIASRLIGRRNGDP